MHLGQGIVELVRRKVRADDGDHLQMLQAVDQIKRCENHKVSFKLSYMLMENQKKKQDSETEEEQLLARHVVCVGLFLVL